MQLAENPTTGYLWKINSIDDKHLHKTEKEFELSDRAIGTGGMRTFYFEIINKGQSELKISLSNLWENDSVETFNVRIES